MHNRIKIRNAREAVAPTIRNKQIKYRVCSRQYMQQTKGTIRLEEQQHAQTLGLISTYKRKREV
jgi:hypothetical protein